MAVAADGEFREREDWRPSLEQAITDVARTISGSFRIDVVIGRWVEWDSGPSLLDLDQLHERATCDVPCGSEDIVLAFSGKELAPGSKTGCARNFGRHALVRLLLPYDWKYREEIILHELLHLFGAWHSQLQQSAMRVAPSGEPVSWIDETASAIVERFRRYDFRCGVESLAPEDVSYVTELFRANHVAGEMHPVAAALLGRAIECEAADDVVTASHCMDQAIQLSESVEGHDGPNVTYLANVMCRMTSSPAAIQKIRDHRPPELALDGPQYTTIYKGSSSLPPDSVDWACGPFELDHDARVAIRLRAGPEPVDVQLVPAADADSYFNSSKGRGVVWEKGFSFRPGLSSRRVRELTSEDVVPKGRWALLIQQPDGHRAYVETWIAKRVSQK